MKLSLLAAAGFAAVSNAAAPVMTKAMAETQVADFVFNLSIMFNDKAVDSKLNLSVQQRWQEAFALVARSVAHVRGLTPKVRELWGSAIDEDPTEGLREIIFGFLQQTGSFDAAWNSWYAGMEKDLPSGSKDDIHFRSGFLNTAAGFKTLIDMDRELANKFGTVMANWFKQKAELETLITGLVAVITPKTTPRTTKPTGGYRRKYSPQQRRVGGYAKPGYAGHANRGSANAASNKDGVTVDKENKAEVVEAKKAGDKADKPATKSGAVSPTKTQPQASGNNNNSAGGMSIGAGIGAVCAVIALVA